MEQKLNILIITASEIKNLELAQKFQLCFLEQNCNSEIINLVELDLPLYSSRTETRYSAAHILGPQLTSISLAHGFVFIAPEYNGSTPPVFNNFLAWLSRSSKDWRMYLNGKPSVIATYSGGGGHHVLHAMRTQLSFIGMNVLGRQILTHSSKVLDEISLRGVSQELVKISGC